MTAIACLLIALGLWMAYLQKSRSQRRLNQLGIEVFASYGAKLRARAVDSVGWLVVAVLLSAGVVMLAVAYESTWGWLVLLPLYAWIAFLLLGT
ncbi:MAG: hypothetical protein ACOYLF_14195 [Blastocatellia bacterium]|jgi:hypothetical protein